MGLGGATLLLPWAGGSGDAAGDFRDVAMGGEDVGMLPGMGAAENVGRGWGVLP